jgi:hypothetical protein
MSHEGNLYAEKHGGEAAIERIRKGEPFSGLAHNEELHIRDQLENVGRSEVVLENAVRLQTAANLYWDAIMKAAEDNDLSKLDRYMARYGWLAGAALRAWAQVKSDSKHGPTVTADMVMATFKQEEGNE